MEPPELNKMLLRPCFGDYGDCPCDDECVMSEYCYVHSRYQELYYKQRSAMQEFVTRVELGQIHSYYTYEKFKKIIEEKP
jgi:hypothetical protein